jgi:tetratricopeptide (TPR) repeat protein
MEFNPNSVDVLWLSAVYLGTRTGSAEAIAQANRAIVLDPLNPFASWTKEYVLYMARQFDEVIEQHKRTAELDPNFFYSDSWVGLAYREKGMLKEALEEYMKVQKLMPEQPLFGLAALYACMGKQQEAKNILRDLINDSKKRYVSPTGIAMVYIALGERDLTFDWLEQAYQAHDAWLHGLKTDVRYEPIRSDPRYAVLEKKMGFEK